MSTIETDSSGITRIHSPEIPETIYPEQNSESNAAASVSTPNDNQRSEDGNSQSMAELRENQLSPATFHNYLAISRDLTPEDWITQWQGTDGDNDSRDVPFESMASDGTLPMVGGVTSVIDDAASVVGDDASAVSDVASGSQWLPSIQGEEDLRLNDENKDSFPAPSIFSDDYTGGIRNIATQETSTKVTHNVSEDINAKVDRRRRIQCRNCAAWGHHLSQCSMPCMICMNQQHETIMCPLNGVKCMNCGEDHHFVLCPNNCVRCDDYRHRGPYCGRV
jgi:hypothetical protein